jgi:hypothetical protein
MTTTQGPYDTRPDPSVKGQKKKRNLPLVVLTLTLFTLLILLVLVASTLIPSQDHSGDSAFLRLQNHCNLLIAKQPEQAYNDLRTQVIGARKITLTPYMYDFKKIVEQHKSIIKCDIKVGNTNYATPASVTYHFADGSPNKTYKYDMFVWVGHGWFIRADDWPTQI